MLDDVYGFSLRLIAVLFVLRIFEIGNFFLDDGVCFAVNKLFDCNDNISYV